jgi:hypothetical protein
VQTLFDNNCSSRQPGQFWREPRLAGQAVSIRTISRNNRNQYKGYLTAIEGPKPQASRKHDCRHVPNRGYFIPFPGDIAITDCLSVSKSESSSVTSLNYITTSSEDKFTTTNFTCFQKQTIAILELFRALEIAATFAHISHFSFESPIYIGPRFRISHLTPYALWAAPRLIPSSIRSFNSRQRSI